MNFSCRKVSKFKSYSILCQGNFTLDTQFYLKREILEEYVFRIGVRKTCCLPINWNHTVEITCAWYN